MPSIIQDFTKDNVEIGWVTVSKTQNNNLAYDIRGVSTGISNQFFQDLKSILIQTGLDIVFDDSNMNFTVFDFTFTLFCRTPFASNYSDYGYFIPVIYSTLDSSEFMTITRGLLTNSASTHVDENSYASLNSKKTVSGQVQLQYRINVHYNDNFLHITYGSAYDIKSIRPILCVMQGKSIENKNVIYISADCNTTTRISLSFSSSSALISNTPAYSADHFRCHHNLILTENKMILNKGLNGSITNINANAIFESLMSLEPESIQDLIENVELKNKLIKRKPLCFGGLIEFENVLIAPKTFYGGVYYTIDDETYFCPRTDPAIITSSETGLGQRAYQQRLLLKI